jgi:hypothetical protein
MGSQQPVLMSWTESDREPETVYEALTAAVSELQEMDPEAQGLYHVVWESTGHNHETTRYEITGFDKHLNEPTILVEGGGGGNYEIITKSYHYPWIKYIPPNQPKEYGWEEELVRLAILTEDFEYIDDNGWRAFLSEPFRILEQIKGN